MRTTTIFALAITLLLASCSKNDNSNSTGTAQIIPEASVPAAVRTTFTTMFSTATEVEWQRDDNSRFRSQFNFSSRRNEAGFDDSGHHLSTTEQCSSAVPAVVLNAFRSAYPNDNVYQWKLLADGSWKPHFMRGTVKWEVTISATGTIIKVEHD